MSGWIKIHRSCLEHWLYTEYRPLTRREAWETILLTVNYEPNKTLIKGQLYECDRGQSLLSINSWAEKFVWSVKQVRTFFDLLEKDNMIKIEGLQYTTRLSVCNYDIYQDSWQTEGKPRANRGQTDGKPRATIKEREEYKEGKEEQENKKFIFFDSLINLGIEKQIAKDWLKVRKDKKASNTETAFNAIVKQIERSGLSANECIKISVERSWSGFNVDWIKHDNNTKAPEPTPTTKYLLTWPSGTTRLCLTKKEADSWYKPIKGDDNPTCTEIYD